MFDFGGVLFWLCGLWVLFVRCVLWLGLFGVLSCFIWLWNCLLVWFSVVFCCGGFVMFCLRCLCGVIVMVTFYVITRLWVWMFRFAGGFVVVCAFVLLVLVVFICY